MKLRISKVALERYRQWAEEDGVRRDRTARQIKHIVVDSVRKNHDFHQLETLLDPSELPPSQKFTVSLYDGESYFGEFIVVLGKDKPNGRAYRIITLYPKEFF